MKPQTSTSQRFQKSAAEDAPVSKPPRPKPGPFDYPRMLYRVEGKTVSDQLIVANRDEEDAAVAKGWRVELAQE